MNYNKSLYKTNTLKKYSKMYLKEVPKSVNILISTGSSGCAIASGMIMASNRELYHIYVPKKSEKRHASMKIQYEFLNAKKLNKVIIVDDVIDSGKTIKNLIKNFEKYCKQGGFKFKIVKVLVYYDCRLIYENIKDIEGIPVTLIEKYADYVHN